MTTYTIIGIIAVAAFIGIWWLVRVLPLMDERQDIWDALDVHLGIPKRYAKLRLRWWWPWGASLRQYTPKGACVWGTVKVPQEQLESFDEGISRQIAASSAEFPNWKLFRKHSDYSALVIDPMATNHVNEPGSPALIVSTGNSQIQCAGVCLGTSWTPTISADGTSYKLQGTSIDHPYIVVPHQVATGWRFTNYWRDSVGNESDHLALFNDLELFEYYRGPRDIHPIFPTNRQSGKSIGRRCVCGQEAYIWVNPDGKTFWVCKGCESVNWECECESQQSSGSEKSIESGEKDRVLTTHETE